MSDLARLMRMAEGYQKRRMDHGYRQRTPGYPEYASQAIRDVGPVARDTLGGMLPGVGEAMDVQDMISGAQNANIPQMALGAAGLALPFVAGRGIQGALDAAQRRVGPVGDVPYEPNALMALEAARGSPAGGQMQVFAGRGSQTADTAALERAEAMAAGGSAAEDIWRETGWWVPTPDGPTPPGGAPRYEIPEPEGMEVRQRTPQTEAYERNAREQFEETDLALEVRRAMDRDGVSAEEAGAAFGLDPGHDAVERAAEDTVEDLEAWRRGIVKMAKLYEDRGRPLHERIDFPELKKAYPETDRISVTYFDPMTSTDPRVRGDGSLAAYYDPRREQLGLNTRRDPAEMASRSVHEVQHVIQNQERGFSPGGSGIDAAHGFGRVEKGKTKDLQPLQSDLYRYKETGDAQYKPAADQARELIDKYRRLDSMDAYERYRRFGGEAEARAVQARLRMTPEERRRRPPWLDYDVPLRDLVP